MLDLLTVGNIAWDISYRVGSFPLANSEVFADSYKESHGGAAGNVAAYAASTFGVSCGVVSVVGNDEHGNALVNRLSHRDAVDCSSMVVKSGGITPTITMITNAQNDKIFYTFEGVFSELNYVEFIQSIPFTETRYLYVAPCNPALAIEIINSAVQHNTNPIVAYNPGTTLQSSTDIERFNDVLDKVDYLFLNRDESQRYSGLINAADVIGHYLKRGIRHLIITDANNGSIVSDRSNIIFQPAYKVNVVEPLGPGDAYASAFLSSIIKGQAVKEAALWGTRLGGYVVTQRGVREHVPSAAELGNFFGTLEWRNYKSEEAILHFEWPEEIE